MVLEAVLVLVVPRGYGGAGRQDAVAQCPVGEQLGGGCSGYSVVLLRDTGSWCQWPRVRQVGGGCSCCRYNAVPLRSAPWGWHQAADVAAVATVRGRW